MSNADSVVIVPGYGLAQARAQNVVKELGDLLKEKGVKVCDNPSGAMTFSRTTSCHGCPVSSSMSTPASTKLVLE